VLQIVLAGGASVGLVPQSLLKSTAVKQHNLWSQAVDVSHHERIQHTMILLAPDNRSASELFSFFLSGDNRALWQKYGFSTP